MKPADTTKKYGGVAIQANKIPININWWLVDVDRTLYPPKIGMCQAIVDRIYRFAQQKTGLSEAQAQELSDQYYSTYGNTLIGLRKFYNVDADEYSEFVYDIPVSDFITNPDRKLMEVIEMLPGRKIIFTNSSKPYVDKVCQALGLSGMFFGIVDAQSMLPHAKPHYKAFKKVIRNYGISPNECAMIDDSIPVSQAAKNLGIYSILVGEETASSQVADVGVESIHQIAQLLQ